MLDPTEKYGLAFYAMFLIFSVTSILGAFKIAHMPRFRPEIRHAKIFYYCLLASLVMRSVTFLLVILVFDKDQEQKLEPIFVLVTIPETLFLFTFLVLV